LIENDPPEVVIDTVQHSILSEKPRITRFPIQWEPQPAGSRLKDYQITKTSSGMFSGNSEFQNIVYELQDKSQSQLL
jgi:hypothetical protein